MKKVCLAVICLVVAAMMVTGCSSGVNEKKPVAEVQQEAKTMNATQLKSTVDKYQQAIEVRKADIVGLQNRLKEIPVTQLMGDEARAIKEDVGQITASIKALSERMKIYAAEFTKK